MGNLLVVAHQFGLHPPRGGQALVWSQKLNGLYFVPVCDYPEDIFVG